MLSKVKIEVAILQKTRNIEIFPGSFFEPNFFKSVKTLKKEKYILFPPKNSRLRSYQHLNKTKREQKAHV